MTASEKPPARGGKSKPLPEHLKAYRGVWVFVEIERGRVHPVSWELMGQGRLLADQLGVELAAVVIGPAEERLTDVAGDAFLYGADAAHLVVSPVLADYRTAPYTAALTGLVNAEKPEILMLGATTLGRDLAGSVATALRTGLTADCTGLAIDPENRAMAATRPTFGGSLLCTILTANARPQMATVRPVMPMPAVQPGRSGRVIVHPLALAEEDIVTKVLRFVPDAEQGQVQLGYADIVVAGGRGMGVPENMALVAELATVLGGEWGGSRPLAQMGWIGADRQIGQTGKTIRPKLYIACGISGAVQHRVGVEGADTILAINTDANAPIMDFAHFAIIGDALQVLPALTAAFRRRLGPQRQAA